MSYSFVGHSVSDSPPVLTVRYEALVDDPMGITDGIAHFLGMDPAQLDLAVFDRRIHTDGPRGQEVRTVRRWSQLPTSMQSLLDDEDVVLAATSLGYDLRTPCEY